MAVGGESRGTNVFQSIDKQGGEVEVATAKMWESDFYTRENLETWEEFHEDDQD